MPNEDLTLNGIIARGLGEGAYFISMPHYQKEIKKKLGFCAYPGTLNLKIGKKQIDLLENIPPIKIKGYKSDGKSFGGADCYRAKIKNVEGAIIIPELTKHKNTIEFIAPFHLKSELNLKEGDKLIIKLRTK